MTSKGAAILRTFQAAFAALGEHAKIQPTEAALLGQHIAAHLRASLPMAFLIDTGPVMRVELDDEELPNKLGIDDGSQKSK